MHPFSLVISRPPTVANIKPTSLPPPTVANIKPTFLPIRRLTSTYGARSDCVRFSTKIFANGGDDKLPHEFELTKKMLRFRDALSGFSKSENPVEYWVKHFEEYGEEIKNLVATAVLIKKLDIVAQDLAGGAGSRGFYFDYSWNLEEYGDNEEGEEEKADENDFGEDEKGPGEN